MIIYVRTLFKKFQKVIWLLFGWVDEHKKSQIEKKSAAGPSARKEKRKFCCAYIGRVDAHKQEAELGGNQVAIWAKKGE